SATRLMRSSYSASRLISKESLGDPNAFSSKLSTQMRTVADSSTAQAPEGYWRLKPGECSKDPGIMQHGLTPLQSWHKLSEGLRCLVGLERRKPREKLNRRVGEALRGRAQSFSSDMLSLPRGRPLLSIC